MAYLLNARFWVKHRPTWSKKPMSTAHATLTPHTHLHATSNRLGVLSSEAIGKRSFITMALFFLVVLLYHDIHSTTHGKFHTHPDSASVINGGNVHGTHEVSNTLLYGWKYDPRRAGFTYTTDWLHAATWNGLTLGLQSNTLDTSTSIC